MTNLQNKETFFIISIILKGVFSFLVYNLQPEDLLKNAELITKATTALSIFFYIMLIIIVQALVHDITFIQNNVHGAKKEILGENLEEHLELLEQDGAHNNLKTFVIVILLIFAFIMLDFITKT
jgi:uncharacterized membrane protein SpoIIM required for sporulation